MKGDTRRKKILAILKAEPSAISASRLGELLLVSRQIIVGDIALLRAANQGIIATSKGYILQENLEEADYQACLACFHTAKEMKKELDIIIENGGKVIDVTIEHEIYGEITAQLRLQSKADVEDFIDKYESTNAKLLTELTGGVHLHTISCQNEAAFMKIERALAKEKLLYRGE